MDDGSLFSSIPNHDIDIDDIMRSSHLAMGESHLYSDSAIQSEWLPWYNHVGVLDWNAPEVQPVESLEGLFLSDMSNDLNHDEEQPATDIVAASAPLSTADNNDDRYVTGPVELATNGSGIIHSANNFANVPQWLHGAYRPPVSCTYCKQKRLQCLILRTTLANPNPILSCSSCVALFRECSLAKGEKRQPSEFETVAPVYNHLHGVNERVEESKSIPDARENTDSTVQSQSLAHGSSIPIPMRNDRQHEVSTKSFSRKGARVLRKWFSRHQEYPYPTDDQKAELADEAMLTRRQVSNWFANARRRQKQYVRPSPSGQFFASGSPMPTTDGFALMTPMERWRRSPPEHEPVPESAIRNAIAATPTFDATAPTSHLKSIPFDDGFLFQKTMEEAASSSHFASSLSSLGTAVTRRSEDSSDSVSSAWSYRSGDGNWPSFPLMFDSGEQSNRGRGTRRHRRKRRPPVEENRYQCTFCLESFKKKHDWCRHEKSVHLSLQSWICTPNLAVMLQIGQQSQKQLTNPKCTFCGEPSPSAQHWETHEFDICADRALSERTFGRKDHLWQHLQKFHHCNGNNGSGDSSNSNSNSIPPNIAGYLESVCRSDRNDVQSRCGFCSRTLQTWHQRADHLAEHFKEGCRMSQWKGNWGLDSEFMMDLRDWILPADRGQSTTIR